MGGWGRFIEIMFQINTTAFPLLCSFIWTKNKCILMVKLSFQNLIFLSVSLIQDKILNQFDRLFSIKYNNNKNPSIICPNAPKWIFIVWENQIKIKILRKFLEWKMIFAWVEQRKSKKLVESKWFLFYEKYNPGNLNR